MEANKGIAVGLLLELEAAGVDKGIGAGAVSAEAAGAFDLV